jgi:divalent metal cation (Fe/Co/Zn/Cd) transporter
MLCKMAGITQVSSSQDAIRHTRRIQAITIAWMSVEAALSLWTAWTSRSPALLAFGGDSFIELFSAMVVLWRFTARTESQWAERRAALVAGVLLFILAAFVTGVSVFTLVGRNEPQPTLLGIAILIAAAVFMPWLAKEKRRLAGLTGSVVLWADAAESAVWWLSFSGCSGRSSAQCDLAHFVGGPGRRIVRVTLHCKGGLGGRSR